MPEGNPRDDITHNCSYCGVADRTRVLWVSPDCYLYLCRGCWPLVGNYVLVQQIEWEELETIDEIIVKQDTN